jgi:hypothetical protein
MRRITAGLLLLCISLVACDRNPTGTDRDPAGTYTLATINSSALPWVSFELGADRIEIMEARLVLNANGSYLNSLVFRVTLAGEVYTEDDGSAGTYSRSDQTITFVDAEGTVNTAAYTGDSITVMIEGATLVYTRNSP